MDFEFFRDPFTEQYEARLGDGLEAIGLWLNTEIGQDRERVAQCLALLEGQTRVGAQPVSLTGQEFSLFAEQGEICIRANALHDQSLDERWQQEGLALESGGSEAWCGVDDLLHLVRSWQAFVPLRH